MSDGLRHLTARLAAYELDPKPSGADDGVWRAVCPTHHDRRFTFDVDDHGIWVEQCPSGCLPREIVRAVDVQAERAGVHSYAPPGKRADILAHAERQRARVEAARAAGLGGKLGVTPDEIHRNLVDMLERDFPHPTRRGRRFRCPACGNERHGGLKVDLIGDQVLIYCHGRCGREDEALEVLGLSWADLRPPPPDVTFDPGPAMPPATEAAEPAAPAMVVDEAAAAELAREQRIGQAVLAELDRREIRRRADAAEHARLWAPPVDYGSFAEEGQLPAQATVWRIGGLLSAGGNALVIGRRKAGKSTIIGAVVKAVTEAGTLFGQFDAAPGVVGWLNYENPDEQQRQWVRELGLTHPERLHLLHLRGRALPLAVPQARRWLVDWLRARRVDVLILDPYLRAAQGIVTDEQDNGQANAFTMLLDELKSEAGVAELVIPAHTGKARAEPGEETARGASRLEDWADSLIYVTKDPLTGVRFVRAEGRDVSLDESPLTFDPGTRGLSLDVFGGSREQLRGERMAEAGQAAVLRALRAPGADPAGLTQNDLIEAAGLSRQKLAPVVAALIARGELHVAPGTNRARLHRLGPAPTVDVEAPSDE